MLLLHTLSVCMRNGVTAIVNAAQGTRILPVVYPFTLADGRRSGKWAKYLHDVFIPVKFYPTVRRGVSKVYRSLNAAT